MLTLSVDFTTPQGPIKPMHGINNAPFHWANCRLFHYLTEAHIPSSRLHDTGGLFGGGVYVDVDNLFPDPKADPTDPASYEFAFNDHLLKELVAAGVKPFYRLGCTIENYAATIAPRRIFPPEDPHRWAVICEHIIRHYNEGWANGYHMDIQYWEIWNEPDNQPDPLENPMWRGSKEAFYTLYEVAANHLKSCFPHLKIGGYAACGFYEILNTEAGHANVSSRTGYFLEFFEGFLRHITTPGHTAPLDFFSWHSYSGHEENVQYAAYVRERLDAAGFAHTESILNEWNPGTERRGLLSDAAYIGVMLVAMQNSSVDLLHYYDAQLETAYGGLFNPLTYRPFKAYHAFRAFGELYLRGTQYAIESASPTGEIAPGVYALAAGRATGDPLASATDPAILLFNVGKATQFALPAGSWQAAVLDNDHDLDPVAVYAAGEAISLPAEGAVLLTRGR